MLCIESKLTGHIRAVGTLSPNGLVSGSLRAATGIKSTLRANPANASLTAEDGIRATLRAVPVDAFFSFSCPINLIESCMSLGGWNDNLGWDNNLGWKD